MADQENKGGFNLSRRQFLAAAALGGVAAATGIDVPLQPPTPRKTDAFSFPETRTNRSIDTATTQHFPDFVSMEPNQMRETCKRVKETGANSLRWNFRWNKIATADEQTNQQALNHYKEAIKVMKEQGLESILVLSDPPQNIKNMAKKGETAAFQKEFRQFLGKVREVHANAGTTPKVIQFENELNLGIYNDWIKIGQMNDLSKFSLPELRQTLRAIKEYFPHTDRLVNIFFSNIVDQLMAKNIGIGNMLPPMTRAASAKEYLMLLSDCKDDFEILGLDYYPGTYSVNTWSDLSPIEEVLKQASNTNNVYLGKKQIALTEFGAVSSFEPVPLITPQTQRGFYAYFGRELLRILRRIEDNVVRDPQNFRQPLTMVSTYQIQDENDPFTPIKNWGVFDLSGNPKQYGTPKSYGARRTSADTLKSIFKLLNPSSK